MLGAEEDDVGAGPIGTRATAVVEEEGIPRPSNWARLTKGQKKNWKKWHKWNGLYESS